MRINSVNNFAYGHSTHSANASKKTTKAVPSFNLQSQSQKIDTINNNTVPNKRNFASTQVQEKIEIFNSKESIVSYDEVGLEATNTEKLVQGAAKIRYGKAESIYNIPYSELTSRLQDAISDSSLLDTNGMTKLEIYNHVQSIFTDYLGKDFLEPYIIYTGGLSSLSAGEFPINTYHLIRSGFESVLYKFGGSYYDPSVYIEAKGYTGMSESEMRTAVRNQYPESMTLKDCILMSDELGKLGLETTAYGRCAVENIFSTLSVNSGGNGNTPDFAYKSKKIVDDMLKMPADFDSMKKSIESNRTAQGNLTFSFNITSSKSDMLKELLSWFGGEGLYSPDMVEELLKMF